MHGALVGVLVFVLLELNYRVASQPGILANNRVASHHHHGILAKQGPMHDTRERTHCHHLQERGSPIKIFGALMGRSLVFFGLRGLKGVERLVWGIGRSSCVGVW